MDLSAFFAAMRPTFCSKTQQTGQGLPSKRRKKMPESLEMAAVMPGFRGGKQALQPRPSCNLRPREVLRVLRKMPAWNPGKQHGKTV